MLYSNYYRAVWYIPQSERESVKPASFLIQSPPYKLYLQIGNPLNIPGVIPENIDELLLTTCIKSSYNVKNLSDYSELTEEVRQDIIQSIIGLFYPDSEFMESLEFSLDSSLDERFSNETWNCAKCQEKGLDKQRNCPMRDKAEYHDDSYSITIGDVEYSECPMPKKDMELLHQAFDAYRIYDSGFLPEVGAYGDQPLLFCILAQRVKDKLKSYEQKALDKAKS